jgi:lipoprotein-anchoring transpeptidase ErfK/SrfK
MLPSKPHITTVSFLRYAIICSILAAATAQAQQTAPAPAKTWNMHQVLVRLSAMGYFVDTTTSTLSQKNKQAIIAFQKLSGYKRTGALTNETARAVLASGVPPPLDSIHRYHVEIDLNRQILFVVDSADRIERILTVSTGTGQWFFYPEKGWREARTPRGNFKIFYKVKGWHKSVLGMMYYPLYVTGGIAIHGAQSVPATPASHGCIRVPMFAATELFRTIPTGTPVVIYGENPKPKTPRPPVLQ